MNSRARKRLLVATIVLVIAFAAAVVWMVRSQGAYYRQVSELAQSDLNGKTVKVGGAVLDGTLQRTGGAYTFTMKDLAGAPDTVRVAYSGRVPDSFGAGVDVVVVGKYDAGARLITADELQTKCPSKYKAKVASPLPSGSP